MSHSFHLFNIFYHFTFPGFPYVLKYALESSFTTLSAVLIIHLLYFPCMTVSSYDSLLDERLCRVTVKVLGASSSPEVSEMCLELLHGQAENGNTASY